MVKKCNTNFDQYFYTANMCLAIFVNIFILLHEGNCGLSEVPNP